MGAKSKVDIRDCPFCQEEIKASAIKCKHCKSNLVPIDTPKEASSSKGWESTVVYPNSEPVEPDPNHTRIHGYVSLFVAIIYMVGSTELEVSEIVEDFAVYLAVGLTLFVYNVWIFRESERPRVAPAISIASVVITMLYLIGTFVENFEV